MKKILPTVDVMSIDDYFALPKEKREKWGLYLKPYALPCEWFDENNGQGWETFDKKIRELYPIQAFFREWVMSIDNPIYRWCLFTKWKFNDIKYAIKHFIKPNCPRWRASYPRHTYSDICTVIIESNFALLRDFWYEEIANGIVDWQGSPELKEFYDWLKSSIQWIEIDKELDKKKVDELYTKVDHSKTYEENYSEINKLEKGIKDKDAEILIKMINYREYFWT